MIRRRAEWSAQWAKDGTGLMATKYALFLLCFQNMFTNVYELSLRSGCDGGMKYRPSPEELRTIGPDFADSDLWKSFYAPSPDKPILFIGMISQ